MNYTITWREIAARTYEVEADSFEEAVERIKDDWDSDIFPNDGAVLFNEYICEETGEDLVENNGYW